MPRPWIVLDMSISPHKPHHTLSSLLRLDKHSVALLSETTQSPLDHQTDF
jgi:hypothetical protein